MHHRKNGFTLIELLVVIAIIGILATLVITQLASSRVKARNSAAKSDVTEMAKSIEVYKNNHNENVLVSAENATGLEATSGDTLNGTTDDDFLSLFTGAEAQYEYSVGITKTPSIAYTYVYRTDPTGASHAESPVSVTNYLVGSNLVEVGGETDTFFYTANGTAGSGTTAISATP
jgi:prepilin-type N-terminal cleavage/methylation domain-containing protein